MWPENGCAAFSQNSKLVSYILLFPFAFCGSRFRLRRQRQQNQVILRLRSGRPLLRHNSALPAKRWAPAASALGSGSGSAKKFALKVSKPEAAAAAAAAAATLVSRTSKPKFPLIKMAPNAGCQSPEEAKFEKESHSLQLRFNELTSFSLSAALSTLSCLGGHWAGQRYDFGLARRLSSRWPESQVPNQSRRRLLQTGSQTFARRRQSPARIRRSQKFTLCCCAARLCYCLALLALALATGRARLIIISQISARLSHATQISPVVRFARPRRLLLLAVVAAHYRRHLSACRPVI